MAHRLGIGVLAIRKGGKLPPPVHRQSYTLEYGTATLEIPAEGIELAGRRVVIIDDVLATGGTVAAARDLLVTGGAESCRWRRWCWNCRRWADATGSLRWPVSSLHTV